MESGQSGQPGQSVHRTVVLERSREIVCVVILLLVVKGQIVRVWRRKFVNVSQDRVLVNSKYK